MATPARLVGVGIFVLSGLLLFAIALFTIGERQLAFARKFVVYTEFTAITGLQPGAIVRVSGAPAGSVIDIAPPAVPSGKFRGLSKHRDLHPLVRTYSVAAIQPKCLLADLLGRHHRYSERPSSADGSTFRAANRSVADLFEQMSGTVGKVNATIDALGAGIEKTLVSVDTTVNNVSSLIDEVSDDVKMLASASARITSDAAQIAEGIRKGEGTVGRLLKDDELYQRVTTSPRR